MAFSLKRTVGGFGVVPRKKGRASFRVSLRERYEHRGAKIGRVRFISQGTLPWWFSFFSMIPTVKLDLIPEIIVIAEPSGEVC